MTRVREMAEVELADVFVEMADTLVDDFDVIEFLHVLTERCVQLLGVSAAGLQHPEVHQATGMILVQLGVSAAVALVRLRAYAYAHDRPLRDVAADVVARRLRFDDHAGSGDHEGAG